MKRSDELAPLSRDHHQALFLAMKLKRATDWGPREDALAFFDEVENRHFELEEGVLLPSWLDGDPGADRALAQRVADEHLRIRLALRKLRRDVPLGDLHELGELLEAHVRFEERELFPAIEAGLSADALRELGAELERA